MALSRFESLPAELHAEILDIIHYSFPQDYTLGPCFRAGTLANLCATSKKLRTAAMPYLYFTFSEWETPRSACRFLRTLCENPQLVELVRELYIGETDQLDTKIPLRLDKSLHPDEPLMRRCLDFLPDDDFKQDVLDGLLDGYCREAMALLPVVATNTRCLTVRPFHTTSAKDFRFKDIFRIAFSKERLKALPNSGYNELVYVDLDERYEGYWYDRSSCPNNSAIELLGQLMNLPKLRRIRGFDVQSTYLPDTWQQFPANAFSSVSSLCFTGALVLPLPALLHIVASCRTLTHFEIELSDILPESEWLPYPGQPVDMNLALRDAAFKRHAPTLRYLKITNRLNDGEAWEILSPLDLREYTALELLKIDEELIANRGVWGGENPGNRLPHTLKSVRIIAHASFARLPEMLVAMGRWRSNKLDQFQIIFPFDDEVTNGFNALPFRDDREDACNDRYGDYVHTLKGLTPACEWYIGFGEHYDSWRMSFTWVPCQGLTHSNLSDICRDLGQLTLAEGVEKLLEIDLERRKEQAYQEEESWRMWEELPEEQEQGSYEPSAGTQEHEHATEHERSGGEIA